MLRDGDVGGPQVWPWLALAAIAVVMAFVMGSLRTRPKRRRPRVERDQPLGDLEPPVAATPAAAIPRLPSALLPQINYEEDNDVEPTMVGASAAPRSTRPTYQPPVHQLVFDDEAAADEPTNPVALIVTSASAQTDKGLRRKRNEDSLLVDEDHTLYVVADGMGGYSGGELASKLAVSTISKAFDADAFEGSPHESLPKRASELARAIQMANAVIHEKAESDPALDGMGTTVVAARFSANKQRLYIGHVGDSRVYRLRAGELKQMTADHTMKDFGVEGPQGAHLSRAVGVWPVVPIDVVLVKPQAGDIYLLCSDGLTKMVSNETIAKVLREEKSPSVAVTHLVDAANANGGKDNITVIVVRVALPVTDKRAA